MLLIRASVWTAAVMAIGLQVGAAAAQGVTPMRKEGLTPSGRKAFYIQVINPYPRPMRFAAQPFETDLTTPAQGARIMPSDFRVAPGRSRRVILYFDIPERERTVALCVHAPDLEGPVLPRVCGAYSGRRAGPRQ